MIQLDNCVIFINKKQMKTIFFLMILLLWGLVVFPQKEDTYHDTIIEVNNTCMSDTVLILNYNEEINISPNPVIDDLYITINYTGILMRIYLIDVDKQELIIGMDYNCNGITKIRLPISNIKNGIYRLKFKSTDGDFYCRDKIIIKK